MTFFFIFSNPSDYFVFFLFLLYASFIQRCKISHLRLCLLLIWSVLALDQLIDASIPVFVCVCVCYAWFIVILV